MYPALHRLEAEGLVHGYWGEGVTGNSRRYYAITPKGVAMLEERLEEWRRFSQAVNLLMPAWV